MKSVLAGNAQLLRTQAPAVFCSTAALSLRRQPLPCPRRRTHMKRFVPATSHPGGAGRARAPGRAVTWRCARLLAPVAVTEALAERRSPAACGVWHWHGGGAHTLRIGPTAAGRVQQVNVDVGEHVRAGSCWPPWSQCGFARAHPRSGGCAAAQRRQRARSPGTPAVLPPRKRYAELWAARSTRRKIPWPCAAKNPGGRGGSRRRHAKSAPVRRLMAARCKPSAPPVAARAARRPGDCARRRAWQHRGGWAKRAATGTPRQPVGFTCASTR